jgi:phosphoribosyl 1,2-cyclic phosphodiesterase
MKITVWGCRGSLATPGPSTLRYGGHTTCLEIRGKAGCLIIVDAGSGLRNLGKVLMQENGRREIFMMFTHSHWDHLVGFPFFTPAYFSRYKINLCGGPNARDSLQKYLSHQMEPPYFPVDFSVMKAQFSFSCDCPQASNIGSLEITHIALNHPNGGYGYKFTEGAKSFVFLTDNELDFAHPAGPDRAQYVEFCRGADLLFHDAQYTDTEYQFTRGWGHSTYAAATDLAIEAKVKRFGLFHHDPDRTDEDLDLQVLTCRRRIQQAGSQVECFATAEGQVIEL